MNTRDVGPARLNPCHGPTRGFLLSVVPESIKVSGMAPTPRIRKVPMGKPTAIVIESLKRGLDGLEKYLKRLETCILQ